MGMSMCEAAGLMPIVCVCVVLIWVGIDEYICRYKADER